MTEDTLLNIDRDKLLRELDDIEGRLYSMLDNPNIGEMEGLHLGSALEYIEATEVLLEEATDSDDAD